MSADDKQFTITWAYTTYAQDMTPQQAAELAVGVFLSGSDPAASEPGHVQVTVTRHDNAGGMEEGLGEFDVPVERKLSDSGDSTEDEEQWCRWCRQTLIDKNGTLVDETGGDCCGALTEGNGPHEAFNPTFADKVFHYYATFSPEAWQDDNAVPVDPQGHQTWNATVAVLANFEYFEREAGDGDWQDVLDHDDVLHQDPAAPPWVRNWTGPFTLTVSRERNHADGCSGLHDDDECCSNCGLHVNHNGPCARK